MHSTEDDSAGPAAIRVAALVGRRMTSVDASGAPHSWVFHFDGGFRVTAESLWRLVSKHRVALTSEDNEQLFGLTKPVDAAEELLALIAERACTAASLAEDTGDLYMDFGSEARLDVLVSSRGYESWALWNPDGTQLVATGGGRLVQFRAPVG